MVFETDVYENITFINRAAYVEFGYSPEDIEKGLKTTQLVSREDHGKHKQLFEERLGGKEIGATEYTARRKNGSVFPIRVHSSAITDNEKNIVGSIAVVINITELRNTEELLGT